MRSVSSPKTAHRSQQTPVDAEQATLVFNRYTSLIGELLDADQRSGATIDDSKLRNGAELLERDRAPE